MTSWIVYKAFFMRLEREKTNLEEYVIIMNELKRKLMIIFSSLNKVQQDLMRVISKYKIDFDFKGTY